MNNENSQTTVGYIRTTTPPPLTSGIYEALMEKAERERDEAREAFAIATSNCVDAQQRLREMQDQRDFAISEMDRLKRERDEVREQLRLANIDFFNTQAELEEQARLITERDHYKQAIEEISVTIQDWLDSIVQEPSLDFIHAIKAWADKKLNNG